MKVAVVGSRGICAIELERYLPQETTEIISGGARGVDTYARQYALRHGIKLTEFLPQYTQYGKRAPLVRNEQIVAHCDMLLAFWDGISRGTHYTLNVAKKQGKPVQVILYQPNDFYSNSTK